MRRLSRRTPGPPATSSRCISISAATGGAVSELTQSIVAYAGQTLGSIEPALLTRARHRTALRTALEALDRALAASPPVREDLLAEDLRLAARALRKLLGRVDVEDILDVIFRDFCIGK